MTQDSVGAPSKALRVMVVDDNQDAARIVGELIRSLGHTVLTISDGSSAVAAALQFQPDVLLLDLVMPGMDGFELARRLRDLDGLHTMKIVALTGFPIDLVQAQLDAIGFDGHIGKPALVDELRRVLGS